MLKKIAGTTFSRILVAAFSFISLILNANFLGADGLGIVGLLILGITIFALISNFVGGAALVYLVPKYPLKKLLLPSYLWSLVTFGIFYMLSSFVGFVPENLRIHFLFIALLQSFTGTHVNVLAGQQRFLPFNGINLIRSFLTVSTLAYFYFIVKQQEVISFIYTLYFANIIAFLFSIYTVWSKKMDFQQKQEKKLYREILQLGFYMQFADIFQLINYRLSYYFVEFYAGLSRLGIYTAGVQLSESLWITSRSISTVQYAGISNMKERNKAIKLSLSLMKVSICITFLLLIILLALPENFYLLLLGESLGGIKEVIWYLSPGILLFSAMTILSHFFSGTGRQQINTISSALGALATLIFAYLLIPSIGIIGAAITSSISILVSFIYLFINMKKEEGVRWSSFILDKADLDKARILIKNQLKR